MKKFNRWLSVPTGTIYEMETDWLPKFGGWELVGTVQHEGKGWVIMPNGEVIK